MANIDIFSIQPHEISRDLCGYTILFYGEPKTGKTTNAVKFPKHLLLAFETGYLAIPGVMAVKINTWSEFKRVLSQLKKDSAHDIYENIIVDTADIAYDLCVKYVCSNYGDNGVNDIGNIPYGQGYRMVEKEFDEALRLIPQLGYGLIMISHSKNTVFTDENGNEYSKIVPTLDNRPRNIVDRMSDIIGYAAPYIDSEGESKTRLFMRGTPRYVAGSRFKYTPDYIDFSYDNLVDAIGDAIDKQADEMGGKFVTDKPTDAHKVEELDFTSLMQEFQKMVGMLRANTGEDFDKIWRFKISRIVEKYLGKGNKISEITPNQVEQLDLIVGELADEISNGL